MKLVSIIVPVYNRAKTINRCYKSLINQDYKNIEIILVDDGSSDNTLEVLKSLDNVTVLTQKNSGPSEARRNGFNHSHGDYICFVDSDDIIPKKFITKLVTTLEKNNTPICLGRYGLRVERPLIKNIVLKAKKMPETIDLSKNREYLPVIPPGVVGKLFKREALELKKVNFRANEDLIIMYPMYAKMNNISINNSAIYNIYYSGNSQRNLLFGYKFDNLYNTFGTLKEVYDEFERRGILDKYKLSIEMLYIKNIFERINNLLDSVKDKTYRNKFISILLDYLEYFFPNWSTNKYYLDNFKVGEILDIYRIKKARKIIKKIKRTPSKNTLEGIYENYKKLEKEYEKNKDYISRI